MLWLAQRIGAIRTKRHQETLCYKWCSIIYIIQMCFHCYWMQKSTWHFSLQTNKAKCFPSTAISWVLAKESGITRSRSELKRHSDPSLFRQIPVLLIRKMIWVVSQRFFLFFFWCASFFYVHYEHRGLCRVEGHARRGSHDVWRLKQKVGSHARHPLSNHP